MTPRALVVILAALALVLAGPAHGSYLVARDAVQPSLKVDAGDHALVSYGERGKRRSVLLWGAINALPPTSGRAQVEFRRDYSGGFKSFGKRNYEKTIRNVCGRYTGPELPWLVSACTMPDGSHWALQSWQRMLPNLGIAPWKPAQSAWELHVSHWQGELPQLEVYLDWVYGGRFHHLFGRFMYQGGPVYGFKSSASGVPLDSWGRNVYLDTLDSAYGPGWKRENSFLAQSPNGNFCYGFFEHNPYPGYPQVGRRPAGNGARYRVTALGPGVTPIVMWEGDGLPDYDPGNPDHVQLEQEMNTLGDQLAGAASCQQH
jgi:hypothetical protein